MWWRQKDISVQIPDIIGEHGQSLAHPLHWLVRVSFLVAKVTRILFDEQDPAQTRAMMLEPQEQLNALYLSFPPELRFETSTFRAYAAVQQGGAFTQLHVSDHMASLTIAMAPLVSSLSNLAHPARSSLHINLH